MLVDLLTYFCQSPLMDGPCKDVSKSEQTEVIKESIVRVHRAVLLGLIWSHSDSCISVAYDKQGECKKAEQGFAEPSIDRAWRSASIK